MGWILFRKIAFILIVACLSTLSYADPIWVDVRSSIEHTVDKIEGDTRISYGEVVQGVSKMFPDKNTEIRLYCRSGGRADKAMSALKEAGYTNVSNAGGIDDVRRERGLID